MLFKIFLSLLVIQLLPTSSNGNPNRINTEIELVIQELLHSQDMLKTRLIQLESQNQDQEKKLSELINQLQLKVAELEGKEQAKLNQNILQFDKISSEGQSSRATFPTSCRDLSIATSGLYTVKASNNKLATVFCDTSLNPINPSYETLIGYNDIKSKLVYFYVQKNTNFANAASSVVTFDIEELNEGAAMDIKTGIFTAPVNGIYHFSLSGIKDSTNAILSISLRLNNVDVGTAYGANLAGSLTYSLESTLRLEAGDEITLVKGATGTILDNAASHYTHFNGRLLEEF